MNLKFCLLFSLTLLVLLVSNEAAKSSNKNKRTAFATNAFAKKHREIRSALAAAYSNSNKRNINDDDDDDEDDADNNDDDSNDDNGSGDNDQSNDDDDDDKKTAKKRVVCKRKCVTPMTYDECAIPRCTMKHNIVRNLCYYLCKHQQVHCSDVCETQ